MKIAVSVILPVCNAHRTLKRAIDSILNQSLYNIELIILTNGCTDNSEAIVRSYTDTRIRHINLPKKGLSNALNEGISLSKSQYIARMDADDWSHPNRLSLQHDYLEKNPSIGLVSGHINHKGSNEAQQHGYWTHVEWLNGLHTSHDIYLNRFRDAPVAHPSVMFRSSIPVEFGAYKEDEFPEDFELWNRWLFHGVRMAKIPQTVLDWYDIPGRLSRAHADYQPDKFSHIKALYLSKWLRRKYPNGEYPNILVWGSGSAVKRRSGYLKQFGLDIHCYIDIKKGGTKSIHYSQVKAEMGLILSYVSDRKGKVLIQEFLLSKGFMEGEDFYMME